MSDTYLEALLDSFGHFTWCWGTHFYVEMGVLGNWLWQDPDYDGDNTFRQTDMSYKQFCSKLGIPYGRDKGVHKIRDYCGESIKIIKRG